MVPETALDIAPEPDTDTGRAMATAPEAGMGTDRVKDAGTAPGTNPGMGPGTGLGMGTGLGTGTGRGTRTVTAMDPPRPSPSICARSSRPF